MEYLQHMKALRFQINDVEDQAAKISFEEQRQLTTIQTMENDITSAKSESLKLKTEIEKMMNAKGQICSQILEKQHKAASLESDSSTLSQSEKSSRLDKQTLELIIQEKVTLSGKLMEKSEYYTKVAEDINAKLQQQQIWVSANNVSGQLGKRELKKHFIEEANGGPNYCKKRMPEQPLKEEHKAVSPARAGETRCLQSLKDQIEKMKPGLWDMDIKPLEEECTALLSDKAEEATYLQSLKDQIEKIKAITHVIQCTCGENYKVGFEQFAVVHLGE